MEGIFDENYLDSKTGEIKPTTPEIRKEIEARIDAAAEERRKTWKENWNFFLSGLESNSSALTEIELASEKGRQYRELLKRAHELAAAFWKAFEEEAPIGDDDFMDAEIAVEKAAKSALESGSQDEHNRIMNIHSGMMYWRFGEEA